MKKGVFCGGRGTIESTVTLFKVIVSRAQTIENPTIPPLSPVEICSPTCSRRKNQEVGGAKYLRRAYHARARAVHSLHSMVVVNVPPEKHRLNGGKNILFMAGT